MADAVPNPNVQSRTGKKPCNFEQLGHQDLFRQDTHVPPEPFKPAMPSTYLLTDKDVKVSLGETKIEGCNHIQFTPTVLKDE